MKLDGKVTEHSTGLPRDRADLLELLDETHFPKGTGVLEAISNSTNRVDEIVKMKTDWN